MNIEKVKLLQDIEDMKIKLASMEEELNKTEEFKHFPSKDDEYYYYTSSGDVYSSNAYNDGLKINVYKTEEEAKKACNKAIALEKVKRRIIELQGDWKPNWKNNDERKVYIRYNHRLDINVFEPIPTYHSQSFKEFPYVKSEQIAVTIINEMEDELKLIFDIA